MPNMALDFNFFDEFSEFLIEAVVQNHKVHRNHENSPADTASLNMIKFMLLTREGTCRADDNAPRHPFDEVVEIQAANAAIQGPLPGHPCSGLDQFVARAHTLLPFRNGGKHGVTTPLLFPS